MLSNIPVYSWWTVLDFSIVKNENNQSTPTRCELIDRLFEQIKKEKKIKIVKQKEKMTIIFILWWWYSIYQLCCCWSFCWRVKRRSSSYQMRVPEKIWSSSTLSSRELTARFTSCVVAVIWKHLFFSTIKL